MDMKQLHNFLELSRTLNFSKAAENLYITQPTLSRSISALEDELQIRLFYRDHRKVELTAAGKVYLTYCAKIDALLKEADRELSSGKYKTPQKNGLLLGIDESVSGLDRDGIFSALDRFKTDHPEADVDLRFLPYHALLDELRGESIDFAVCLLTEEELEEASMWYLLLSEQPLTVFVPKSFSERYRGDPEKCLREAFSELDLCLLVDDKRWANNFRRLLTGMGLPFHPIFLNGPSIENYIRAGRGISIDFGSDMYSERNAFQTPIMLTEKKSACVNALLWNQNNNNGLVQDFLTLMQKSRPKK